MSGKCLRKKSPRENYPPESYPQEICPQEKLPPEKCPPKNCFTRFLFLFVIFYLCFYHVTYAFQSVSTLCICLNAKELLAQNRRHIWSLSDCNGNRTQNQLVRKQTLNHLAKLASLAKWLSVRLRTNWLWIRVWLQSLKHLIVAHFPNFHSN